MTFSRHIQRNGSFCFRTAIAKRLAAKQQLETFALVMNSVRLASCPPGVRERKSGEILERFSKKVFSLDINSASAMNKKKVRPLPSLKVCDKHLHFVALFPLAAHNQTKT